MHKYSKLIIFTQFFDRVGLGNSRGIRSVNPVLLVTVDFFQNGWWKKCKLSFSWKTVIRWWLSAFYASWWVDAAYKST